jgi:hypothetical protein
MDEVPLPDVITQPPGRVQLYVVAPVTGVTEYVSPLTEGHTEAEPDIVPGVPTVVLTVTGRQVCPLLMPQELVAVTQMFPVEVPALTPIELLPCPEMMYHPLGTVHE